MKLDNFWAAIIGVAAYWTLWFLARPSVKDSISDEIAFSGFVSLVICASHFRLSDLIDMVNERVESLANRVGEIDGGQEEVEDHSPRALTEKGRILSKAVNAKDLATKYRSHLGSVNTKQAYDIQEACLAFAELDMLEALDDEDSRAVKKYAYENGKSVERVLRVIGIEMRDMILAQREND
ncbi:MAG: hypothetical protein ISQ19_01705 [PS1 clade bacterium]|uniref:Uncharacterized protein n=1 Tax=PS1 clade bacterium TaxID=2175152 RepID=A0A937HH45_9PROT|nr:hypothetical protein [PS1 clade bacterium]